MCVEQTVKPAVYRRKKNLNLNVFLNFLKQITNYKYIQTRAYKNIKLHKFFFILISFRSTNIYKYIQFGSYNIKLTTKELKDMF